MAATMLPSNFVTPDPRLEKNPNWTLTETAVPNASILTEDIHDRLLIISARHPLAFTASLERFLSLLGPDGLASEQSAVFQAKDLFIQQCSGFQLESIVVNMPMSGSNVGSRNLTSELCGEFVDDDYSTPRRFVFSDCSMSVPISIDRRVHVFNMTNHLPNGQQISYYKLGDVIDYFITGFTNYMRNVVGDSSFYCTVYVNAVSPRLFWWSSTYPRGGIGLLLSDVEDSQPNFITLLKNHLFFTDLQSADRSQATAGYDYGESLGFIAQARTSLQNNALGMSIHCNELTQFRKSDSIAPADGASIIGVLTPQDRDVQNIFYASVKDGTLISPKISFDRTQTCTQTTIYFRVLQPNGSSSPLQLKGTEVLTSSILLTFRVW